MVDDWSTDALCLNKYSRVEEFDWWFSDVPEFKAAAIEVCMDCPVAEQCFQKALYNGEQHGVWGGVDFGWWQLLG